MRSRVRRGFSLLEALVALLLVSFAALGALQSFAAESRAVERLDFRLHAEAVAAERLASLQLVPRHFLRALPDSLETGTIRAATASYTWSATATRVRDEADLFEVRVRVRRGDDELTRSLRLYRPDMALIR